MVLRDYGQILWRYRFLMLPVVLIAMLISAVTVLSKPTIYTATARMTLLEAPSYTVKPLPATGGVPEPNRLPAGSDYDYDRYYQWLTSEYVIDDMTEIAASPGMLDYVIIPNKLDEVNPLKTKDVPNFAIDVTRKHRILTVAVSSSNANMAADYASAMIDTINSKANKFYNPTLNLPPIFVQSIERPGHENVQSDRTRKALDFLLRSLLGLVLAIGLAFFLNYLDDRVRTETQAEELLELPVLASIPPVSRP